MCVNHAFFAYFATTFAYFETKFAKTRNNRRKNDIPFRVYNYRLFRIFIMSTHVLYKQVDQTLQEEGMSDCMTCFFCQ